MNKEQPSNENPEQPLVPYETSLELAKSLLDRYYTELREAFSGRRPFDEEVSPFTHDAITHFLKTLPHEQLEEFWGHGISKRDNLHQLAAFLNILANRTIKGDTGRLISGERTYIPAYIHSPFLILSHYKKPLGVRESGRAKINEIGLAVEPGAFVVNNNFYPIVDELKHLYPNANIIRANELPHYIAQEMKNSPRQ